jgi:hypothetical protein
LLWPFPKVKHQNVTIILLFKSEGHCKNSGLLTLHHIELTT